MIDISKDEFLEYLDKYANNEISMSQLVKDLQSDNRTINYRIMELSVEYPNLYYKIVTNHPYKQKSRTDIDFEALMIYALKNGLQIKDLTEIFNVSRRTIQRRVNEIKDQNPSLYNLFKSVIGRESKKVIPQDVENEISKLEQKEVIIGEINEEREKFLLDIERRYNELVLSGMSREQAVIQMGYTKNYIFKALNELYRINIEKNARKSYNKQNSFIENLTDMSQYTENNITDGQNLNKTEAKTDEAR